LVLNRKGRNNLERHKIHDKIGHEQTIYAAHFYTITRNEL
jgi:hypothetical protein